MVVVEGGGGGGWQNKCLEKAVRGSLVREVNSLLFENNQIFLHFLRFASENRDNKWLKMRSNYCTVVQVAPYSWGGIEILNY